MRRYITPWRVLGAIAALFALTVLILLRIPANQYMLLPDIAHPVAPLVRVQDARPVKSGTLYFVDVKEQSASVLDTLIPWLHPHSSFVPSSVIVPPCVSGAQAAAADQQQMAFSQRVAAVVALRKLGYHVVVKPTGVTVEQLIPGTHAPCNLQLRDVVVAVNGTPTPTEEALHAALARVTPGAVVKLRVRRGGRTLTVPVRTVRTVDAEGREHALVGFAPNQSAIIKLPLRVSIDAGNVGGPSAGLAFALELMQQLGRDVTHGRRVAATGEIELNGAVFPIGGVKQKTYGARQAGADVFLVPAGKNARDARRYAGPLRIIPVRSLDQALHALATLPSVGSKP
ncbi:MAG TPA: S16 family serine protease [Gaiellaceae bacterium]